jgi:DNA-directed RNA polymerase specialized sigma24 family protein
MKGTKMISDYDPRIDSVEGRAASKERKRKIEEDLSAMAKKLTNEGYSISKISEMMDFPQSTIRSLLQR